MTAILPVVCVPLSLRMASKQLDSVYTTLLELPTESSQHAQSDCRKKGCRREPAWTTLYSRNGLSFDVEIVEAQSTARWKAHHEGLRIQAIAMSAELDCSMMVCWSPHNYRTDDPWAPKRVATCLHRCIGCHIHPMGALDDAAGGAKTRKQ